MRNFLVDDLEANGNAGVWSYRALSKAKKFHQPHLRQPKMKVGWLLVLASRSVYLSSIVVFVLGE